MSPSQPRSIKILDIGCGTGAWLKRLSDLGFSNLYGLDSNLEQLQFKDVTVVQFNLDESKQDPFKDKKFSLITAIEVIEHLENPGHLFQFVADHLEEDGYFLLTTPNIHSVDCRLRFLITGNLKSFDSKGDSTHIYPVLITALERVLPRYSLSIYKQWGYPEKGSLVSRPINKFASKILSLFLPKVLSGDTMCLVIKKNLFCE